MRIDIYGPQGCGKSIVLTMIEDMLRNNGLIVESRKREPHSLVVRPDKEKLHELSKEFKMHSKDVL
jgi:nucleoside-triphosphatase THEP1